MPLLEAVVFLKSEIGSTSTEKETKTEDNTNNSSMIEQLMSKEQEAAKGRIGCANRV